MAGENLVYEHFPLLSSHADAALLTAIAIEAATGDKFTWTFQHPVTVSKVGVQVVVAIDYDTLTAACVVAFDKRVTYGSDTGRVELGRVTIPHGTPAGAVIYIDLPHGPNAPSPDFYAGQQLICEVVTQGAGGTEVGDWQPVVNYQPSSEIDANQLNGASVVMARRDTTTVQVT